MGLYDGINSAELFERGRYLPGGFRGKLRVLRTMTKETRAKGPGFIVEFEVIESNLAAPEQFPPGAKCTWFVKLANKDTAFPAIKAFVAALCGFQVHQKQEIETNVSPRLQQIVETATANPDRPGVNPLLGIAVGLETVMVQTKAGGDFTRHDWSPVTPA